VFSVNWKLAAYMALILTAVWVTVHTVKRKLLAEWRTVPRPLVLLPIMLSFYG